MMQFSEDKLKAITKKIVKQFEPERVILFGSQATGQAKKESDVDLLVIKETKQSTREIARQIDGFIFPRPFPIDLIVYTPLQLKQAQEEGDFFILEVLSNGKTLYVKPK